MKRTDTLALAPGTGRRTLALVLLATALLLPWRAAAPADAATAPGTGAAAATAANTPLYTVEMVVYRAVTVGTAEDWAIVPPGRGFGAAAHGGPAPQVIRVLGASSYRLDGVVDDLRINGAWRTVAHAAWVQTAPPWGTHIGVPLSQLGVTVPGLSGTVYLERAPLYLHLGFDVNLTGAATYTINEMRYVRPNEKQYFDHPAFGIIAAVTPIKQPPK